MLAHYTILSKIGAGGMGEVYRARDTKLDRDVALKVLPKTFATNEERLMRFKREAQVLASLNHSNIAAIYGLEDSNGLLALVMELVEGATLAERIGVGPIPIVEALPIAKQIAAALEAAHERSVIHRDLKPANVKVTHDGSVKVLDFGLAKILEGETEVTDLSHSPTLLKGTAAYMSPEQAKGKVVDKRSDIWAFGCVLFEMLTGKQSFNGETLTDTLAAVVRAEPDWDLLPGATPREIRRLLRRCLNKDSKERLRDIGEARIAIEEVLEGKGDETSDALPVVGAHNRLQTWQVAALAVVLTAALSIVLMLKLAPTTLDLPLRKFDIAIPQLDVGITTPPVISPDGRKIAYVAGQSLWVREFGSFTPREAAKGNSPQYFFWSPDSNYLAYIAAQKMWRVPAIGGQPSAIAEANFNFGAYTPGGLWTEDGRIVFAPSATGTELLAVSAEGGEFSKLIERESKTESDFHKPSALPQNKGILFIVDHFDGGPDEIDVLAGNVRKTVLRLKGSQLDSPVYSPTGHILYRRDAGAPGIWALPFSLEKLEATGESFLVSAEGSWPSVSSDGTLLFTPEEVGLKFQLVWVDHAGKVLQTMSETDMQIWSPRVSPEGDRVAFVAGARGRGGIYVLDLNRRTRSRLTLEDGQFEYPSWSADGKQIYYDLGFGAQMIVVQPADGNSPARQVAHGFHGSVSRDGKYLFFEATREGLGANLWYLPLGDAKEASPFLEVPGQQREPQLSSDGRFVVYYSNESGQNEVFVKDFPRGEGKWQVSTNGGRDALWSRKGDRIFYINGDELLEVDVTTGTAFTLGTPRVSFNGVTSRVLLGRGFDLSADGNRFLTVQQVETSATSTPLLTVVENWFAEFKDKQKK
jgi:Tol biopolymer transport system component/tRNA A-37 threonylcarbamoyl transferase component Bud32